MPFTDHILRMPNGEDVPLRQHEDGRAVCPVCGALLDTPPYDFETANPSRQWCPCCETQFGWDDLVPPDAPQGAKANRWRELREQWLNERSRHDEAEAQLKNLGEI